MDTESDEQLEREGTALGPACCVYIPLKLDELALVRLDEVLVKYTDELRRTRKGRVFEAWINGRPVSICARPIDEDNEVDLECLVEDGIELGSAFEMIELSAGLKQQVDYDILTALGQTLIEEFGGWATDPIK